MNPALLNQSTSNELDYASRAEAVAAFHRGGSRDWLARTLARDFERQLGRDCVLEAVDHALERALTNFAPNDAGRYPARKLYRFAATAAWNYLAHQIEHNGHAVAPVYGALPDVVERVLDRHAATPEDLWLDGELAHQVREAAAGLDELTLQVLWLRHVEGLKKPQIEAQLGLTAKRVRTLLHAGNERLCALFQGVESGTTCGGRQASVLRLAFDLATGQEARRARAHVGHCRDCARRYERAQAYRRAVAGLVPFPLAGHVGAGGLLAALRHSLGGLLGHKNAPASRTRAGSHHSAGATAGSGKLAAVGAAALLGAGGLVALHGAPAHDHKPKPAVHVQQPTSVAAPAPPAPQASREHVALVRASTRSIVLRDRRGAERRAAKRAAVRHAAARKATAPATDEFFSPSATPSGQSTPPATSTTTPTSTPTAPQTTSTTSGSGSTDEFATP